jgi:hypothetical protein
MSFSPTIDLAHYAEVSPQGKPLALLGEALLNQVQLVSTEELAAFGLSEIWFARFVAAGVSLPHPSGKLKYFDQSQLRLKLTPLASYTAQQWRSQHQPALVAHLLQHLTLTASDIGQLNIELDETCCFSPCFGCRAVTG